ncbi:MAG: hypothetical protein KAS72_05995 [Phycisphaerales bacterium]|nr:hypothetical protein [Phycisphaerales bacterium]
MKWFRRLRLKMFGILLAVAIGCMVVLSTGVGWLTIPVVGAALWAMVVTINRTSAKAATMCWSCGCDLSNQDPADGSVVCSECGTLHQPDLLVIRTGHEQALSDDEADEPERIDIS